MNPENVQAFPCDKINQKDGSVLSENGMTLLDYFAAKAPIGFEEALKAIGNKDDASYEKLFKWIAQMRFQYAKAMMEARNSHV